MRFEIRDTGYGIRDMGSITHCLSLSNLYECFIPLFWIVHRDSHIDYPIAQDRGSFAPG